MYIVHCTYSVSKKTKTTKMINMYDKGELCQKSEDLSISGHSLGDTFISEGVLCSSCACAEWCVAQPDIRVPLFSSYNYSIGMAWNNVKENYVFSIKLVMLKNFYVFFVPEQAA